MSKQKKSEMPVDAATACSPSSVKEPLRVAYSREELASKMAEWMVRSFGHPMDYITEPDVRDKWLRDNGLIYQFICAHFPENDKDLARRAQDSE